MKNVFFKTLGTTVLGFVLALSAYAQAEGDYRSVSNGDWSAAATWEVYESGSWTAASSAPTGSETIWVTGDDTVSVDVAVSITGRLVAQETGVVEVGAGSLEIADGGVYQHDRDEGSVPTATWSAGSTFELTGVTGDAPDNTNQDYHHIVFNTPDLLSNEDLSLDGVTIGGDITVASTGSARWYLTSGDPDMSYTVTIMGDVLVQDGQFAVQGTGDALTTFIVHHYGDIDVTGGNFSVSRGSQGSGSGTTTWYLYGGNFTLADAAMQNSNPTPGNAQLVFAGSGVQQLSVSNVDYAGGDIHFHVSDSTTLEISDGFEANGQITNEGEINPLGSLTFIEGGIYVHARDGGTVPDATWEEGSTAMFTGITADAPDNRGQDYFNLTLDTPDMMSNNDLSLDGNTISGDINVISSGSSRWRLVGGSSGEVTIMGDVVVDTASFETQGTGSLTDVVVHHWGNVDVNGGNFSVSRGSQASGTGTTLWYFYGDTFAMTDAETRNSNPTPGNARFVFAKGGSQELVLENTDTEDLSIEVSDSTTLDLGTSVIGGSGIFWVQNGAGLATAHIDGLSGNLQTSGEISIGSDVSVAYDGTETQSVSAVLPDTLHTLTIANPDSVVLSDTNYVAVLDVQTDAILVVESTGSLTAEAGTVAGRIVNEGEVLGSLTFTDGGVYVHARDGGTMPDGTWEEGSTAILTGVTADAPDNRGQDYYNLTLDTPGMLSNNDLSLAGNTISGDIRVLSSGDARWRLVGGDDAEVTIMGDVIVRNEASFETLGTGSPTTVVVHHYGDVDVSGGNFSVSRGSQGSGTGTTTWYLYEGDFMMANAETRNSNPTPGNAKFVFAAGGQQLLTLGEGNEIEDLSIEVSDSTTLDVGTSEITGSGIFTLQPGATLATSHVDGVAGSIQTEGTVTLTDEANFAFYGDQPQVTSEMMPMTVHNLVISNEAGVTLSQATTITGTLRLIAGQFDNTIPFTLAPGATISFEGGSLLIEVSSEDVTAETPTEFELYQNYPNPFNPATVIRYDIKENSDVTVTLYDVTGRMVKQLVNETHAPGTYQVEWNANGHASGVYYYQIRAGNWSATRSLLLVK